MANTLWEFLRSSPLVEVELDLVHLQDTGRQVELDWS